MGSVINSPPRMPQRSATKRSLRKVTRPIELIKLPSVPWAWGRPEYHMYSVSPTRAGGLDDREDQAPSQVPGEPTDKNSSRRPTRCQWSRCRAVASCTGPSSVAECSMPMKPMYWLP